MRTAGLVILIVGFSWIVFDTISSFTSYQHIHWVSKSKSLPAGESIPRKAATSAMRELSLSLKDRHRMILLPSALMLGGGLLIFFGGSSDQQIKVNQSQPKATSD